MTGGTITRNQATEDGGGVYVDTYGTFTVSGAPEITDNKKEVIQNNVFLANGQAITITGTLGEASFGVTMENPGTFTTGVNFSDREAARNVFSSDQGYEINLTSLGQATTAVAEVTVGDTTTGYASFDSTVSAWNSAADGALLRLLTDVKVSNVINVILKCI